MKYSVSSKGLVFLLLFFFVSLRAQTMEKQVWFAPLPPLPQYAGRPFIGSEDFMQLFHQGSDWPTASQHVNVFKLYGEWVGGIAKDSELRQVVADLKRRNIKIAVEMGPLTSTKDCGMDLEGFSGVADGLYILNRIKAAGGEISYIALDEPYYFGSLYTGKNACNWSIEKIAKQVDHFIRQMKTVFPNVIVGDIEPLPSQVSVQDYKDWIEGYRKTTGYNLSFLHMDLDFYTPKWPEMAKEIETFLHERGIDYGIIYFGDWNDNTDKEWLEHAEDRMAKYESEVNGQPDHPIFQSWNDHPDFCLPEKSPTSFTHLINLYHRTRTNFEIIPQMQNSNGLLTLDVRLRAALDNPIMEAPVDLFITSLYGPTAMDHSVLLSSSETTNDQGNVNVQFNTRFPNNLLVQAHYPGKKEGGTGINGFWPAYGKLNIGKKARNLTQEATVTSSHSTPDNPAEKAIDIRLESIWNSGGDAPQWIRLKLNQPHDIWQIRLAIGQDPSGYTVHHLLVKGPAPNDKYQLIKKFSGKTKDLQILEFTAKSPLKNIQYIKIETLASPSWVAWREIDVIPWSTKPSSTNNPIQHHHASLGSMLHQNIPNPFHTHTTIKYEIRASGTYSLQVLNHSGQVIRTLANHFHSIGSYSVKWNGKDDRGHKMPSGYYIFQLKVGNKIHTKRMLFLE